MQVPKKEDIPHKLAMYKLLVALLENAYIANQIFFKGGSCAAMLGYLDRFSVDLDFDLPDKSQQQALRKEIHQVIDKIGFEIKDESQRHLQFFLKYRQTENERNSLKLEISDLVSAHNQYHKAHLIEIDKYCQAQTAPTMFANKLVAFKARWDEGKGIAGRDVYDVYYFAQQGLGVNQAVVEDLRGVSYIDYLEELTEFIQQQVSEKILYEDLNPLMSKKRLNQVVPGLKSEVLLVLKSLAELAKKGS
jgi:predicted nucleotidyltransferase component of viral defense system